MGTVLVSSEIEDIVDKDNILGHDLGDMSNLVEVTCESTGFSGILKKIKKCKEKTQINIGFFPGNMNRVTELLLQEEKSFSIGGELSFEVNSQNLLCYTITHKKDMYIWKIIIDNSE